MKSYDQDHCKRLQLLKMFRQEHKCRLLPLYGALRAALHTPLSWTRHWADELRRVVAPRQGDACVFFPSHHASKEPDPLTTHYSDVAVDDKWIVQVFERERRVPPPLGLPDEAIIR